YGDESARLGHDAPGRLGGGGMRGAVAGRAVGVVMTVVLAPEVALHDVTVAYDRQPAVHHLSGSFKPASLTAVVGPNGAGKRMLFARMVVQDAPLVLLDEPFAAIDSTTTTDLLALTARWHGEGRTVIAVLHDLSQVRERFPETLLLAREGVAWGPTASVLTSG